MTDKTPELLARLEARSRVWTGMIFIQGVLLNPDGPEAAAKIIQLQAERDAMVKASKPFADRYYIAVKQFGKDEADKSFPEYRYVAEALTRPTAQKETGE